MTNIIGNISKAAETRQVNVGGVPTFVTDFNIAENYSGANGERKTQFYRVTLWRDAGTKLAQYLTLGRPLGLEGRVKATAYIDKNGEAQAQLVMTNPHIKFITANPKEGVQVAEELPFVPEEE